MLKSKWLPLIVNIPLQLLLLVTTSGNKFILVGFYLMLDIGLLILIYFEDIYCHFKGHTPYTRIVETEHEAMYLKCCYICRKILSWEFEDKK